MIYPAYLRFPISRDPPEGGTRLVTNSLREADESFQFLGIPPKGEHIRWVHEHIVTFGCSFQFLGIPPKGERASESR